MTKKRIWIGSLILALMLQVVVQIWATVVLMRLEMLPTKYLIIYLVLTVLLMGATAALMFLRGKKQTVGLTRKIISMVMAVTIAVGYLPLGRIALQTKETVDSGTGKPIYVNAEARNVYVLTRADDAARSLSDAAGYTFGAINGHESTIITRALDRIESSVGKAISIRSFSNYFDLADALLAGEIGAIVVNGATFEMLSSERNYTDFPTKVRILNTLPYAELKAPGDAENLVARPAPYYPLDVTRTPFIMYLSGSDTRNDKLSISRSDVNILVIVNPTTKQILMVNTPRDYYVSNPAGGGAKDKLTHCGLYGVECSMQALENLYGMTIDYYAQINFKGFETLVDAMGGITVVSGESFRAGRTQIYIGPNELNGPAALDYARERYNVAGGDNGRGENQMELVEAIIDKLTSVNTLLFRAGSILESLEGMFATNMSYNDISKLVKLQLDKMPNWNICSYAVTGVPGNDRNYSAPGTTAYVTYPDQSSVNHAADLINMVLNGQYLTEADLKN